MLWVGRGKTTLAGFPFLDWEVTLVGGEGYGLKTPGMSKASRATVNRVGRKAWWGAGRRINFDMASTERPL